MTISIDLATETAEGFDLPPFGVPLSDLGGLKLAATGARLHQRHGQPRHDADVFAHVTSAHLGCGLHSGDPSLMRRTAAMLVERGVRLGAHPSYPDLFGFGQRRVEMPHEALVACMLYQLGGLAAVVGQVGARLRHVKCHGALAFDIAYHERYADAMIDAVLRFDPELVVILMARSPGLAYMRERGIRVAAEGYVDRGYDASGRLVPRDHPQALLKDPSAAAERAVRIARDRCVTTVDGKTIDLAADTLCLHSDTEGAGAIAGAVSAALARAGVDVRALTEA